MPATVRHLLTGRFLSVLASACQFGTAWAGLRLIYHRQESRPQPRPRSATNVCPLRSNTQGRGGRGLVIKHRSLPMCLSACLPMCSRAPCLIALPTPWTFLFRCCCWWWFAGLLSAGRGVTLM